MTTRRTKFATPRKGTKIRQIVNLALRPCGVCVDDLPDLIPRRHLAIYANGPLRDEYGFDILPMGRAPTRYRIIGRWRYDGSYRSFLTP